MLNLARSSGRKWWTRWARNETIDDCLGPNEGGKVVGAQLEQVFYEYLSSTFPRRWFVPCGPIPTPQVAHAQAETPDLHPKDLESMGSDSARRKLTFRAGLSSDHFRAPIFGPLSNPKCGDSVRGTCRVGVAWVFPNSQLLQNWKKLRVLLDAVGEVWDVELGQASTEGATSWRNLA